MHNSIKKVEVQSEQFSPLILKTSLFTQGINYPKGYKLEERYVYDYELEFFVQSEGSILVEGEEFQVSKGDIMFRRPGQFVQGIMPYSCYIICFDLLGNTGKDQNNYDIGKKQDFQNYYINPLLDVIPTVIYNPYEEKYQKIFDTILKEFVNMETGSCLLLKSYMLLLLYQLYNDVKNPLLANKIPSSPHYTIIKNAITYMEKNIHTNISLEQLAQISNLSPSHFHKIFTRVMNITPNEYVTKLKLDTAKELLVKSDISISDIALQFGFENSPYFSYLFKKWLKLSPGEFRKKHKYF